MVFFWSMLWLVSNMQPFFESLRWLINCLITFFFSSSFLWPQWSIWLSCVNAAMWTRNVVLSISVLPARSFGVPFEEWSLTKPSVEKNRWAGCACAKVFLLRMTKKNAWSCQALCVFSSWIMLARYASTLFIIILIVCFDAVVYLVRSFNDFIRFFSSFF